VDTFLAIASKREVRSYDERPISGDVERRILEAGRIAGSAANRQPWRFIVVEDRARVERLAEASYEPSNLLGARLIVAIAVSGRGPSGFDAGRAGQNMMLAAWNDGVGSCPNGLKDRERAAEILEVEEGEEAAIVLTFGYPARKIDPESRTPDEWIARAKRKPFDEVVKRL
jgi:nitroreductase